MNVLVIISAILFFGFIAMGIGKFGLQPSYSIYSKYWGETVPLPNNLHLWSIVTIISALLLVPPMIEIGDGNSLQFLGFLTPLYLVCVALTPTWWKYDKEHILHVIFTLLCVFAALFWCIKVAAHPRIIGTIFMLTGFSIGFFHKEKYLVFFLEMVMFLSTYLTLMI